MKNNKTFIKNWKLGGLPYTEAEMKNPYLLKKLERALTEPGREAAAVWLTDDPREAEKLIEDGACVVYLLTGENREIPCSGAEWCAEVWEQEDEMTQKASEMPWKRDMPGKNGLHPGLTGWKKRLMEAEKEGLPDWLPEDFLWRVWLRRCSLPWHICETRRLALREMMEEDLDFLYEMQENRESGRFLDRLSGEREEERQKLEAYRQRIYGFYGFGIWMIIEKESGACVGRAGLQMRDGFEEPELGFAIAEKYRRKGYAKEACLAVLEYAKEELEFPKVRAVVDGENINSQRLCEKLGFTVDKQSEMDGRMCIFFSKKMRGAS